MNVQDVDLNLLRVFDAVLQERSVTAAAARLGLTQPAVSNALARLRTLLGDALFVRTPVGMEATPFARGVAEPVRQALALLDSALAHGPGFEPASATRAFRFYMSDLGQIEFLPPPMPIPVADVAVHWHERFDADQGNRWLREQLIELFAEK